MKYSLNVRVFTPFLAEVSKCVHRQWEFYDLMNPCNDFHYRIRSYIHAVLVMQYCFFLPPLDEMTYCEALSLITTLTVQYCAHRVHCPFCNKWVISASISFILREWASLWWSFIYASIFAVIIINFKMLLLVLFLASYNFYSLFLALSQTCCKYQIFPQNNNVPHLICCLCHSLYQIYFFFVCIDLLPSIPTQFKMHTRKKTFVI